MPQVIRLRKTINAVGNPSSADGTSPGLLAGEPAVCVAATATKIWVGVDGVLVNNRLLFSTVDSDAALMDGVFLKLTGGVLTGPVTTNQTTFAATALVTRDYVDTAVASATVTTISETAPTAPQPGDFWFDPVGTQLYIYYDDGTSAQWVVAINNGGVGT